MADRTVRPCAVCAADFMPKRHTSRTCSRPCLTKFNNATQNAKRYAPHRQVECEGCGTAFVAPRSDSRVCSTRCRNVCTARTLRRGEVLSRSFRGCAQCSVDIRHLRSDAAVCSQQCATRHGAMVRAVERAAHQQARTATLRNATVGNGVPPAEWARVVARAQGRCFYCERRAPLTMDHIVPISRGGKHKLGNVVPACRSCNSRKHKRFLMEWPDRPRFSKSATARR